ncbi:DUF412 domain-containing protein [Rossellomorea vietnamensis]|uniref:DUF412 domain-containing protein n=1 Tax=Rossellomorea vietnamensis TaxID=218284 RepID=A0A5D4NXK2_9BACI|nr:DUF412 domain-containing protein [Rossellomorea vietnamensis]TYS18620.1 DUF412 domain-containing protein [Rossellomorea vietnamensis]
MLVIGSILLLIVTLALSRNVKKSKRFAAFYIVGLAGGVFALLSAVFFGGWDSLPFALTGALVGVIGLFGMMMVLLIRQRA